MAEYLDQAELISFLNEMLEAERAGSRVTLGTSQQATSPDIRKVASGIQQDEARWCAMLYDMISHLHGAPSTKTGSFYEKAMAISDLRARFNFLNKGQGWVVRKLRETIPQIADERTRDRLETMLRSHEGNIAKVIEMGLADR